jgi:hypothetical protein
VKIVDNDIAALYENWFIETCDEWVIAYIADLIKARILQPVSNATYSQRAWVANTIGYRRRKGTLATLEQIARDVTGWDARAVEFFELLVTTQYLNHLRLRNPAIADLRDMDSLDKLSTPFNTITHTIDVRHIDNHRGYYNIPNIGIFIWRLQSFPVYDAPAFDHGDGKFSFNRLGYEVPLFNHPRSVKSSTGVAEEINIGGQIRMLAMDKSLKDYYYGELSVELEEKSIQIRTGDLIRNIEDIIVCDLRNWAHRPPPNKIAIDPVLGRILFPANEFRAITAVHTTHYYGFSGRVGGGFYIRPIFASDYMDVQKIYRISQNKINETENGEDNDPNYPPVSVSLTDAIEKWIIDGKKNSVFEILDSEFYDNESLLFDIPPDTKVVIRAKQERQPILRLANPIRIRGKKGSSIIFDGLIFDTSGNAKSVGGNGNIGKKGISNNLLTILQGDLKRLTLRHCTLVPGRATKNDLKFLFTWNNLLDNTKTNTNNLERLKKFLVQNIENVEWINNENVKLEFVSGKVLKISSPTTPDSFLSITLNSENTAAVLRANTTDEKIGDYDNSNITSQYSVIYEFSVTKTSGKFNIYVPKMSLSLTGAPKGEIKGQEEEQEKNDDKLDHKDESEIKNNDNLVITMDNTICGKILIALSEARVEINNSIIDGKGTKNAITCYLSKMENSTIFGRSNFVILELASNVMFTDSLIVKRHQIGCVRFCYISPGSYTPRRYHCQPEYFNSTVHSLENESDNALNIFPRFTSIKYGEPGYAQLYKNTSEVIFEGADNGSEIGVFNNIYQAQRINNLKSSLDEYLRFGLEAGIFLVD